MKKSIKLWIEALEGGEFKQGRKMIKNGDKYCCLGVACELYNRTHKRKVSLKAADLPVSQVLRNNLEPVRRWLRLKTPQGRYDPENSLAGNSLTDQNDHGATFKDIAEIIKNNVDSLFFNGGR